MVVDKFGDDIAPYAVNLARNLTAAFWKYSGQADGDEDADEDDQGTWLGVKTALPDPAQHADLQWSFFAG